MRAIFSASGKELASWKLRLSGMDCLILKIELRNRFRKCMKIFPKYSGIFGRAEAEEAQEKHTLPGFYSIAIDER